MNQLVRENNQKQDFSRIWTYDDGGNIRSSEEYAYTTGSLDGVTPTDTITYSYGDNDWGDLLTAYNGTAISYDEIGNPLTCGSRSYTWEHGRELATLSENGTTWTYTYDANGMRTGRTNGITTYSYVYNGSQLSQMTVDGHTLNFTYDAAGIPLTVTMDGNLYYYVTNLQGDVIHILNQDGVEVAAYTYDAWGVCTHDYCDSISIYNPLRYRGYVYDSETWLYYLQSRYYDPEIGRFLNGDAYVATGQGLLGNNMFAYCNNNPVNMIDVTGEDPGDLFDTIEEAAVDAAWYIGPTAFRNNWEYSVAIYSVRVPYTSVTYKTKTYKFLWFTKKVTQRVVTIKYKTQYSYTRMTHAMNSKRAPIPTAPWYGKRVAIVHTHPMGSGSGVTSISDNDIYNADGGGGKWSKYIVYVYGPNGQLKWYNPNGKQKIGTVETPLPKSRYTPWAD